ncbi:MAG: hypothetical protein JNK00_13600 [Flavipsychrobacter sp.]|nr:hypothetical protein [Flavipsychrobacter sp.]
MKLSPTEIEQFFDDHLPYKITQLKTHHCYKKYLNEKLSGTPLARKYEICAIEISFVAGRLFMDFLGLGLDKKDKKLVEKRPYKTDDITVIDLGGKWIDVNSLTEEQKNTLAIFYHRGNKGSAHLTWEKREKDGWETLDDGVEIITSLLKTHLYDIVGKPMKEK